MLLRPSKKDGADARERSLWADLVSMGMVFPIAIVLGYYLGRWIGGMAGHQKAGGLIGLGFGVLTGFWELFKVAKRLEKHDAAHGSNGHEDDSKGGKR
jgi:F0F1-type ATP synthase assembly protein I